jgi:sigma-E factor negative regulatory protein RseC
VIEAVATVREVDGPRVLVEVQRRGACGGCESSGSCGTSALGKWLARGTSQLRLRTNLPVRAGEAVVIGLEEAALLRASLLLYLLPVLCLIAGALGGAALAGTGAGDWLAILGGALGLAGGLLLSRARAAALPDAGVVLLRRHDEPVNVLLDTGPVRPTTTRSI